MFPEYRVLPGDRRIGAPREKVASGGEADIYRLGNTGLIKLMKTPTVEWMQKVEWAVHNKQRFRNTGSLWAAWPQYMLVDAQSSQVVGLVMSRLDGYLPLKAAMVPELRAKAFPDWDARTVVGVAANMARCFHWLHQRGVVHGDGSPGNVMVNRQGRVALIDCDSSQYDTPGGVLPCRVSTADYCPPDLQPKTAEQLATTLRSPSHDVFSVAVMISQLLGGAGAHPFSGRWDKSGGERPPSTERRIELNAWSGTTVGPCVGKAAPPQRGVGDDALGERLRELKRRSFDDGWIDATRRPSLQEWIDGLERFRRRLIPCVANRHHCYDRQLTSCPYCEAARVSGYECFPARRSTGFRLGGQSGWRRG